MAASERYLTFDGQFESNVLGTFKIIRGFANLKDLAEISVPYVMEDGNEPGMVKGQQRQLDQGHAERIRRYLESGEQRFIPEVILSVRIQTTVSDVIKAPFRRNVIKSDSIHGITIEPIKVGRHASIHRLRVDREMLEQFREQRLIRRVDGNHRLALADKLADDAHLPTKYLAPFCIIILGPPGETADDYSESLIFHTINSTALPLESEHALKLILGQNSEYDMKPEKEFAFSPDLHFTRLLRDGLLKLSEPAQSRLGNRPLTCLRAAVRGLLEMDATVAKDLPTLRKYSKELLAALNDIVTRLEPSQPALCQSEFFIELAARVWKATPDTKHIERVSATVARLEQLAGWLGKDGLIQMKEGQSLCKQVLDVFDAVRTRIPKRIFLARWYPTAKDGEEFETAKLRLKMIKQALKEIQKEQGVNLELIDMGTETGGTFPIHRKMYDEITVADIVLVDLTGVRPNVCVEAGYALKHHEKNRLIFIFQLTDAHKAVPFDLNTFRYEPFKDTGEIPEKIKPHIVSILQGATVGA